MGVGNKVVPADQLKSKVWAWADEILMLSPTALKVLKQSFNTDTEQFASVGQMAYSTLKMFGELPKRKKVSPRSTGNAAPNSLPIGTIEHVHRRTARFRRRGRAILRRQLRHCQQRSQLTQGLSNSPELLQRLAELGWLGY